MVAAQLSDHRLTPDGAAWLAKALHPADVTLDVHGVPTLEGVPTATLDFMTTQTIAAPSAAAWKAEVLLNPSPMYFGKVITSTATPTYGSTTIYNPTLTQQAFSEFGGGAVDYHRAALQAFCGNVIRYRLLYASVTATMSASSTTNQGTVVSGQYPKVGLGDFALPLFNLTAAATDAYLTRVYRFFDTTRPNTTALQQMKGSVSWDAKEGVYLPLKLDEQSLTWKSTGDLFMPSGFANPLSGTQQGVVSAGDLTDFYSAAAASAADTPFGPQGSWNKPLLYGDGITSRIRNNGGVVATAHMGPSCSNMGHMVFQGLDPAATIMLTYRVGFEVVVAPGSTYSQSVTQPVRYDPLALEKYFSASREMMSAYPAKYNIFGAILPFLKKAGEFVLPKVSNFVGGMFAGKAPQSPPSATTSGGAFTPLPPAPPTAPAMEKMYAPPPQRPQRRKAPKPKKASKKRGNKRRS